MIKYKYSITCEEINEEVKRLHFVTIKATSFNACVKKFNINYPSWEIVSIVRL